MKAKSYRIWWGPRVRPEIAWWVGRFLRLSDDGFGLFVSFGEDEQSMLLLFLLHGFNGRLYTSDFIWLSMFWLLMGLWKKASFYRFSYGFLEEAWGLGVHYRILPGLKFNFFDKERKKWKNKKRELGDFVFWVFEFFDVFGFLVFATSTSMTDAPEYSVIDSMSVYLDHRQYPVVVCFQHVAHVCCFWVSSWQWLLNLRQPSNMWEKSSFSTFTCWGHRWNFGTCGTFREILHVGNIPFGKVVIEAFSKVKRPDMSVTQVPQEKWGRISWTRWIS